MNQTSVIFAYLLIGFIVFVTIRGELRSYLSVLGLTTPAKSATGTW